MKCQTTWLIWMTFNMSKLPLLALVISLGVSSAPNSIVAIVNDHLITRDALNTQSDIKQSKESKLKTLNQQIDILLQIEKATQLGVKPKSSAINNMLSRVAKQNKLTLKQLQTRPEFGQIMDSIQQKLSLNGLRELISSKAKLSLSQAEIDQALKDNPAATQALEDQVRIAQIAISTIDKTDSLLQSQDDLIQEFLTDLASQIQQGASFSALAKLHSQDESYKDGGESDWLVQKRLPKAFMQALKPLKVQELSAPFKAGNGWRLIKVIERRQVNNHLKVIKSALIRQKKNLYFRNWTKKLRKDAYIEIFDHKL
ncbi:peptidylprolyl isomerase [Candidatus Thioglobus sp.]|uniref:peptidylprolyl isomerase n=1 Tax=Candidatus Thioglobus sp. TaxID=2026721 RepID=UPI0025C2055A|nr:peptidylprolyl isomerase [Candidatus Thioglobus sp.]